MKNPSRLTLRVIALGRALLCGISEFAWLQGWRWRDRLTRRAAAH